MTGSPWNQLPERYGKWNSVYRFHLRWAHKGVFKDLLIRTVEMLNSDKYKIVDGTFIKVHQDACYPVKSLKNQAFGKTKGGRNTKLHAMTNKKGKMLGFLLRPGNEHEMKSVKELIGDANGSLVLGDTGYDSDELRNWVTDSGGWACIPPKENAKRYVFYDKEIAKPRHVVENFFSRVKRFRRISTRYERLSETYESFVCLAAIKDWLC